MFVHFWSQPTFASAGRREELLVGGGQREVVGHPYIGMQAASLGDVANYLQAQQAQAQQAQREDAGQDAAGGVMIAPGVRFSDKLWERLGGKTREIEKQKRRERLTDITAFPEVPTSIFDTDFRRDAMWKKRYAMPPQLRKTHLAAGRLARGG